MHAHEEGLIEWANSVDTKHRTFIFRGSLFQPLVHFWRSLLASPSLLLTTASFSGEQISLRLDCGIQSSEIFANQKNFWMLTRYSCFFSACLPSSSAPARQRNTSRRWRRPLSLISRREASAIGSRQAILLPNFVSIMTGNWLSMTWCRCSATEPWPLSWHSFICWMLGLRIFQLTSVTSKML